MPYKTFLGYPSISKWMYTCFIASPPKTRDEIMDALMANGHTMKQAIDLYKCYWLRFVAYRVRLASQDASEE